MDQQDCSDLFSPSLMCVVPLVSFSSFSLSRLSLRPYSIRQVVNTGEKGIQCHVTVLESMTEKGPGPSSQGNKYIAIFLFRV